MFANLMRGRFTRSQADDGTMATLTTTSISGTLTFDGRIERIERLERFRRETKNEKDEEPRSDYVDSRNGGDHDEGAFPL